MKNARNTKDLMLLIKNLKRQLNNDNVKFQTAYCPGEDFPAEVSKTTREHNIDLIILTANIDPEWKSYFIGPFGQQGYLTMHRFRVLSIKPSNDQTDAVPVFRLAEQWGRSINLSGTRKREREVKLTFNLFIQV
ncbi:MAG: hypothetical protein IPN67_13110 [Bacteroidales bacterium]|nr:hypothetical protein [Bacteroidales bacterium]